MLCICHVPHSNIAAQATFSVSGTVSNSDNPQLLAKVKVMLMSAPLARVQGRCSADWLFCSIRSCLGGNGNCEYRCQRRIEMVDEKCRSRGRRGIAPHLWT